MRQWLTPDSAPPRMGRAIYLPGDNDWHAALRGALMLLANSENWEQYGTLSPEETAREWQTTLFDYGVRGYVMRVGDVFFSADGYQRADCLPCDGSEVSQATYPALYAIIGAAFGAASSGNFKLPDLRGRAAIGTGQGAGLTLRALGDMGGEETHQLTVAEMPAHEHSVHTHGVPLVTGVEVLPVSTPNALPGNTGSEGGDGAHENMPPFLTFYAWIVAL